MSSSSLPPSLKKINVFLKRAEELDRDKSNPESRVVAYNVRQYAVLQGIPLAKNATDNGSANKALGQLLDTLETEKHAMSVFSKNEHWKICRKVADRVFDKADSEDRAGVANKGTARSFYAAGTFYEILQQFHNEEIVNKMNNDNAAAAEVVVDNDDVDEDEASVMEHIEEENQRRIYCKWKATDILNAIKEGRSPTPGGYKQQNQENDEIDENEDDGGGSNVVEDEGIEGDVVPLPPPSVPSSDLFELPDHQNNTPQEPPPPPSYDGIELSLSGQPTTTTTETSSTVEKNAHEEMFIPPPPSSLPPPYSYSQPPPPQNNDDPTRNNDVSSSSNNNDGGGRPGKGMFSSIFHNNSNKSSNNKKLSKEQMGDAIELTKFALAALQNGDGELGRERLEQALGVWR